MARRIIGFFREKPGLLVLLLYLSVVSWTNLKPGFHFLGWDNYSSYFNLKTNLFRTFFATWRQYRGVGVPSDSESTDIFRQLFFVVFSPVLGQELLDQVYILVILSFGTIAMYFLARSLFSRLSNNRIVMDISGFTAAVTYLFNLNTLATFYFPMIMFVSRFFTVPVLILLLHRLIRKGGQARLRDYLLFSLIVIVTSGTYMTATVYITVSFLVFLFLSFQKAGFRTKAGFFILFIGLNCFWLLPFANYTVEKSTTVNDAPTFIEANEIQLNKPASYYSFEKQFTMYPGFFDTGITSLDLGSITGYHPIVSSFANPAVRTYILLTSVLAAIGALLLLLKSLKHREYAWIPIVYFLFLLLSFKAFSPLGFIYAFLETRLPFFGNLFRFGDTKFHFFMSFTGSLALGYLFGTAASKVSRKIIIFCTSVFFLFGVFVYRDYPAGRLFGFFMRNRIPEAYFQIAKIMNDDTRGGRILHLPYDANGYWRSYSWGYLGSSFLNFMVDRPLLEKTFEPASADNADINGEIYRRLSHMQSVLGQGTGDNEAESMYAYLKKIGVRYVLMDGTVTSELPSKGISLWGKFNSSDSQAMVSMLLREGWLKEIVRYPVKKADYIGLYEPVFPLKSSDLIRYQQEPADEIVLYELLDPDPQFMAGTADVLKEAYEPFKRTDASYEAENGAAKALIGNVRLDKGKTYTISLPRPALGKDLTLVEVYARADAASLHLVFIDASMPDIASGKHTLSDKAKIGEMSIPLKTIGKDALEETRLSDYLSNWRELPYKNITSVRIKIGNSYLPLPSLSAASRYVGALTVAREDQEVELLIPRKTSVLGSGSLRLTDKPNCFDDAIEDYSSSMEKSGDAIRVSGKNGSTCFLADLAGEVVPSDKYLELEMKYLASQSDNEANSLISSKKALEGAVRSMPKPNNLYTCIKEESVSECFNVHQVADLSDKGILKIPTEKQYGSVQPIILFSLKNTGLQSQTLQIDEARVKLYKSVYAEKLEIAEAGDRSYTFESPESGPLTFRFSLPMNASFYQTESDGFLLSNGQCTRPDSYRTFRKMDSSLLSYFSNCDNSFFTALDFTSDASYLWSVDYNLASGKFPRFVLGDGFYNYKNDYLSLDQGYPDIPGFKKYQYPETLFSSPSGIKETLRTLPLKRTYTVVANHPEYVDRGEKGFTIFQDSENEGLALFGKYTISALPSRWYSLSIEEAGNTGEASTLMPAGGRRILPSLWEIGGVEGKEVLVFNEGYDRQWGAYASLADVVLGRRLPLTQTRCREYFNCFSLVPGETPRYVFYEPERLNIVGWIITLLFVSGGFFLIYRRNVTHT